MSQQNIDCAACSFYVNSKCTKLCTNAFGDCTAYDARKDKSMFDIEELTLAEVENMKVDLSMVHVCAKIRKLAKLDRISLDESTHHSGLNKHLLSYLDFCSIDRLTFIKQYLSNLQPFMLVPKHEQEKQDGFICIIDNMYRIGLYIKLNSQKNEEVIISFHEDNKRGIAISNHLIVRSNPNEYVAVFERGYTGYSPTQRLVSADILMQRGLLTLPLPVAGYKYQNVLIVRRSALEAPFVEYCNNYLQEVYTSDLNLDFSRIKVFSYLQQISFTSYGKDTFETLSLLIDCLCLQADPISRAAADFAIVEYAKQLKLSDENRTDLLTSLTERYSVSSIRAFPDILNRIELALTSEDK